MDWTGVRIFTTEQGLDAVTGSLLRIGINGFELDDPRDFRDFLDGKFGNWDYLDETLTEREQQEASVKVYLPQNAQGADMLAQIKAELSAIKQRDTENAFGRLTCELDNVREEDWANNWKQYFKPIAIGEKLLVRPSWEAGMDAQGRTILEIDPASSFGTGQHNTTRLCLEMIEKYLPEQARVLDLGCGSGILSIAALLLGADRATAVDIDENSVKIAGENAAKNKIEPEQYRTFCGDITSDVQLRETIGTGYDFICANIVADVLTAMSGYFAGFLKQGGILAVSGIIDEREEELAQTIQECGFSLLEIVRSEGWSAEVFCLR